MIAKTRDQLNQVQAGPAVQLWYILSLNPAYPAHLYLTSLLDRHMSCLMTKPAKWYVRPLETQISLGVRPVWSESLLSTWWSTGSSATHWAHWEDSDQTGQMPCWSEALLGAQIILLVLSWGDSYAEKDLTLPDCQRCNSDIWLTLNFEDGWKWCHVDCKIYCKILSIKVNRKVQEEPQTEVAANPWHQEEEKKWHRLECA